MVKRASKTVKKMKKEQVTIVKPISIIVKSQHVKLLLEKYNKGLGISNTELAKILLDYYDSSKV